MNKKENLLFKIFYGIVCIFCLGVFFVFGYYIFKLNIVPSKYLIIGCLLCSFVLLLLLYLSKSQKHKWVRGISLLFLLVISIVFSYATYHLYNTYSFLNNTQSKYDVLTYSVIVQKNSRISKLNDLQGQRVGYLNDAYQDDVQKYLSKQIHYTSSDATEFLTLVDSLLEGKVDAICLEESYLILAKEEVNDFEDKIQIIDKFEVKVQSHKEDENKIDISSESFVLYISGIDQYGNVNSVRGRSDVNQLAIVNPKTHHILLVNTPRDYYVQLAGTTGLRDKLTHAGIYGIDKSIATLENLYHIDINHYLRVNFDSLIKVVDVIGGIEVYSDTDLWLLHDRNYHVKIGMNQMNGKQALAYSRERYGYITGDHHRGANQQQVITAIINKVSQSSVLIGKYNSILNALDGSFQTDMPTGMITSFIKYQLDSMPTWNIESIAVTGSNSMDYTYSMGTGRKLYVMEPNYESVEKARKKIQEVYNEK